ncbi:MAG: DUF4906 domain-containing protein [Bacteroidales bacterium]|nr:DUF4906 domain-containing protein [Bacteroidales bacterium]
MKMKEITIAAFLILSVTACGFEPAGSEARYTGIGGGEPGTVRLVFQTEEAATRSEAPDEELVSDINVFIFNGYGLLEEKLYISSSNLLHNSAGDCCCDVQLLSYSTYSVYVCANTGFKMSCGSLAELLAYRYYLAYPDDYRIGVPMSGKMENFTYKGESEMAVPLRRAMAKISLSIDRSALDSDVDFTVTSATIGNCPKSALMFADNVVSGTDDTYNVGYRVSDYGSDNLNRNVSGKVSGEVSLYMFENMQGSPLGEITDYVDKEFLENDPLRERCSYVELVASYYSSYYHSLPGEGLIYRFYLGESASDFNVERNCHYHVTLRPEGTGLNGRGWRVDKSALEYCGPTSITITPSTYIRGKIGDVVDVRAVLVPESAPLDVGLEELRFDHERGIYDYAVDPDGLGVTLTFTGSGMGMLYFEAGDPINNAELIVVVVDLP